MTKPNAGLDGLTLDEVRAKAKHCTACPLYKDATQTVFGEGPIHARVLMVGEQPGDQEDRAGRPFVGPAGRLLNEAFAEAGLDRSSIYITNTVKHFKWTAGTGKRRVGKKPNRREVTACKRWLDAEISLIKPAIVVALGATAAQALMGPSFRLTANRGRAIEVPWTQALFVATVHPSSVLRPSSDRAARRREFIADLKKIAALI